MDNIVFFKAIRPSVANYVTQQWHDIHKPIDNLTPQQLAAYTIIDGFMREILMDLAKGTLEDAKKQQDRKNRKKGGIQ